MKNQQKQKNMIQTVLLANDKASLSEEDIAQLGNATFVDLLSFGFTVEQCEKIMNYARIEAAKHKFKNWK